MSLEYMLRRVMHHEGSYGSFQERYTMAASEACCCRTKSFHKFVEGLMPLIADERNLRLALDYVEDAGGTAPGKRRNTTIIDMTAITATEATNAI